MALAIATAAASAAAAEPPPPDPPAFPGLHGRIYRGLVIGSGAHWVVVGVMLRRIAAAAQVRHRDRGETAHVD